MRIRLVDPDKGKRKRSKGRRRRSRTYDAAISQPRIPRRTRERRRHTEADEPAPPRLSISWRAILIKLPFFLVLVGLIAVVVYASTSEEFFVYSAEMGGVKYLDATEIYMAAGVHEQNVFWLRPAEIGERISQVHGIKDVSVQIHLPARVIIDVEEREPIVVWRVDAQEKDWWLDAEGMVLSYGADSRAPGVIFVVDSSERHLQPGDRVEPEGIVESVQQLAEALPQVKYFEYEVDRELSFDFKTGRGEWPVYVGTSENLARKIQVVQTLDDYLAQRLISPSYIDVRIVNHPVYGKPLAEIGGGNQ